MVPCEGRLIQLWMYYRNGNPDDNHYAHPLDFIPVVDLNLKKVTLLKQHCLQLAASQQGCCAGVRALRKANKAAVVQTPVCFCQSDRYTPVQYLASINHC